MELPLEPSECSSVTTTTDKNPRQRNESKNHIVLVYSCVRKMTERGSSSSDAPDKHRRPDSSDVLERRFGEDAASRQYQSTHVSSVSLSSTSEDDTNRKQSKPTPLTVFARHQIQRGKEHLFEAWIQDISNLQYDQFEGYRGVQVVRPTCCHSNEYVSIFRYDDYEKLQRFMDSEERQRMLRKTCDFEEAPIELSFHSLEYWFVPPEDNDGGTTNIGPGMDPRLSMTNTPTRPPPRWKMVIVTFLLIWFQAHFLGPWIGRIPNISPLAAEALTIFTIVLGTTYLWMPLVTKHLLHWWLFPQTPSSSWKHKGLAEGKGLTMHVENSSVDQKDTPAATTATTATPSSPKKESPPSIDDTTLRIETSMTPSSHSQTMVNDDEAQQILDV